MMIGNVLMGLVLTTGFTSAVLAADQQDADFAIEAAENRRDLASDELDSAQGRIPGLEGNQEGVEDYYHDEFVPEYGAYPSILFLIDGAGHDLVLANNDADSGQTTFDDGLALFALHEGHYENEDWDDVVTVCSLAVTKFNLTRYYAGQSNQYSDRAEDRIAEAWAAMFLIMGGIGGGM